MSDEKASTGESTKVESKPSKGFSFVQGGTSTTKSEALYERRYQEAEERRKQADQDRRDASVPIEEGGAKLLSNQLTAHPEIPKAYVPLKYVDRLGQQVVINGEPVLCLADLIVGMNPSKPTELTLVLVCPRCSQDSHKHQQDNQIMIRQSNKAFEFVAAEGDPTFVFEGVMYRSAGVVKYCEPFQCPDCHWRARIDNNRVWPD